MTIHNVATLAYDGVAPFELGVLCEAWGIDRSDSGGPTFDFAVCAPEPGRVATSMGFALEVEHGLERLVEADLVTLPAMPRDEPTPGVVIEALQAAVARGARVLSVCSGAFTLGDAGLLDGRDCTTHWRYTCELEERYPKARVHCDVLYVDADPIITSAGSAAGLDACLHLIRKEFGARAARSVARRMVVPPHREGGQAQFIETPVALPQQADSLAPVLTWMTRHLDTDMPVAELARRAAMSPRTFARRFRAETGTTPHQWMTAQRLLLAERLLEESDAPIEAVASRSGFGNAAALRHHFVAARGTTPQAFRRTFGQPAPSALQPS
ncbi:MAG TPA: helix-turn-helix domain-containing protein [Nocardioidaceae bacterium]|nr:helix-turn-helix domain-containing protein [Nocardioidaceae bacterium]